MDELRKVAMTQIDLITECSFNKSVTKLELSDRVILVQAVKVILSSLAELTQFHEGMATLGIAKAMADHPNICTVLTPRLSVCVVDVVDVVDVHSLHSSLHQV